jgi:hypothetical protein
MFGLTLAIWVIKLCINRVFFRVSKYGIASLIYRDKEPLRFWLKICILLLYAGLILSVGVCVIYFYDDINFIIT